MELLNELNPMQRKAAEITEGPLLILAGAGSGKTRTVIYRIAHLLLNCNVKPYQILALTFTNKAAGEMRSRIEKFDIPYTEEMWMGTFHSICARILRIHASEIGFERAFTIYDSSDSKSLIKQCLAELDISDKKLSPDSVLNMISSAKNNSVGVDDFFKEYEYLYRAKDIAASYRLYQKKLKENNAMDFDDLLFNTYTLFTSKPDVLEYYQNRFLHILVDEYQDTNKLQYEIVALIAKKHKNICVCGDDDQSIYGWRGADIRNILEFEEDFPNAKVVRLEQNYRSTANILNGANAVIKHNKNRKGKNLWTDGSGGEKIHILENMRDIEEGERIASEINKKLQDNYHYSDFAVLYRTNAQSRVIEEALIRANIPYQIVSGTRFYERLEIKDIMSYLRVAVNPHDSVSFTRSIQTPKRGVGASCIDKLSQYAQFKQCSVFEAAKSVNEISSVSATLKTKILAYTEIIDQIIYEEAHSGLAAAVKAAVNKSGYIDFIKVSQPESAESRIDNLNELINAAADFEASSEDNSLNAFLENAALIAGVDNIDDDNGQVLLMSIHNSKGLEFKCVFVAGVEEGLFPLPNACEQNSTLEEERRLCYVAMTRAMKELYLSYTAQRRQYGTTRSARPSRFLGEIPPELTDARSGMVSDMQKFAIQSEYNKTYEKTYTRPTYTKPISPYQSNSSNKAHFEVADKVEHPKWGVGTIIDIMGSGDDTIYAIAFAGLGIKKIMPKMVELKKV